MKQCKFCGEKTNIKIAKMFNTQTKEHEEICHVCFNQAARCGIGNDEGLLFEGQIIKIALPKPSYSYYDKTDGRTHYV